MWVCHTLFLAGLPFGRAIGWIGQVRDDHTVPVGVAFKQFWPHTALGLGSLGVLAATHPAAIPYALLIAGGPALSIPLAVFTARPVGRLGARAHRHRPAAGRDRAAGRAHRAGAARGRRGDGRAHGLEPCSKPCAPHAG